MNKTIFSLAFLFVSIIAGAQVITQIGKENMKIPVGERPDEQPVDKRDFNVQLDTTSVYYTYLDSAQTSIEQQDWASAEHWLRQALAFDASNSANSMLLSNLATVQRYEGKLDEALKNYTLALDITPNAVTLLLNRAALLLQLGRTEQAVTDYERVSILDDKDVESRYSLGMIAVEQRDFSRAETMFNEIRRIKSTSALADEGMGFLYKEKGDFERAIEHLSVVIKSRVDAHLLGNRADCYLALKRLNDASADIKAALEIDPDDGYLYLLRAKLNKLRYNREDMGRDIELAESHGVDGEIIKNMLEISPK
ncbi:MAG: tetratricopeptide repeat protein [Muribaculaceae bacterium]|nr:tetratricopeptide repeat protein [Muribaculaceae bacterium]